MSPIRLVPAALLIAACSADPVSDAPDTPEVAVTNWTAADGSGLCVADGAASAFVLYAEDGSNCMAEGLLANEANGSRYFTPRGDRECRIPIAIDGATATFGAPQGECAYYCGGTATIEGRALTLSSDEAPEIRDLAGEAIC